MDKNTFVTQTMAAGLGLLIRGLNFKLEGESKDASTRGARLYIDYLEGVKCPHCNQSGTLARIKPVEKRDLSVSNFSTEGMSDRDSLQVDALMLDEHSFINTDGPAGQSYRDSLMGPLEHQVSLEKQLKDQTTNWLCISCFREVLTTEFIEQMRRRQPKAQGVTRSEISDVAKSQRIHVFFVAPKQEQPDRYYVLGDSNSTTARDLDSVGGMYECVVFHQGDDPEEVKRYILNTDLDWQDQMRARCDLHFFYPLENRSKIVSCLEPSKAEFVRALTLHSGDEYVGHATFKNGGYSCGSLK